MATLAIAFSTVSLPVQLFAKQTNKPTMTGQNQVSAELQDSERVFRVHCEAEFKDNASALKACLDQRFEVIKVYGSRPLPISIGLTGKYALDREFLDNNAKGNGNITDMLTILPGIQASENALDVELQSEIRSQLISISGAQPWQTGFFFDGISNNSLIDPGASQRSVEAVNDVQGHPQSTFINQSLVGEVEVYDSNIPARFGQFSGGVVNVKPREYLQAPSLRINYRTTRSSFNRYNLIDERQLNEEDAAATEQTELPSEPMFDKQTLSLNGRFDLFDKHRFVWGLSTTRSKVDELSLLQLQTNERKSTNLSLRYSVKDAFLDELNISVNHSPYEGTHLLTDVLNSELKNKGGGTSVGINTTHNLKHFQWNSRFNLAVSENSRQAPNIYLPWYRAPGKAWGIDSGDVPFSIEGGYGDIEKLQNRYSFENDLSFDDIEVFGGDFRTEAGLSLEFIELERNRTQTALVYNSPFRDANLDCNGQMIDCVEQTFRTPLDELFSDGIIDFSDPEQSRLYSENILTRGQFFQYRRVYPLEDILVERESAAGYVSSRLEYERARITIGLRAEYDSVFENLNIAPRIKLGLDPFGDNQYLLSAGVNRYYSTGPMTYLIREQQRPYTTQYRTISSGSVGDWLTSTQAERFRYDYSGLNTPYNDEFSLGYQQALFGGILSLNAVLREQKDQVTRSDTRIEDGITIISQDNLGSGEYERFTLSYNRAFNSSVVWFHVSRSENQSSSSSYDDRVDNVPEDELVVLQSPRPSGGVTNRLISQNDLTLRNLDFSRPISANLNLQTNWTETFKTTVNFSYVGSFESAINTNSVIEVDRDVSICQNCNITNFSYPLFVDVTRPAVTLINLNADYRFEYQQHEFELSLEVSNLMNDRTYTVGPNQTGLEVGRSFWLGISYEM